MREAKVKFPENAEQFYVGARLWLARMGSPKPDGTIPSESEIADKVGVGKQIIYAVERGFAKPSQATISGYEAQLGIVEGTLLRDSTPVKREDLNTERDTEETGRGVNYVGEGIFTRPRRSVPTPETDEVLSFYKRPEVVAILKGRVYVELTPEEQQMMDAYHETEVGAVNPEDLPRIVSQEELTWNVCNDIKDLKELVTSSPVIRDAVIEGFLTGNTIIYTPDFVYEMRWEHDRFNKSDMVSLFRRKRVGDHNDKDFLNGEYLDVFFSEGWKETEEPKGNVSFNNWKRYHQNRSYRDTGDLEKAEEFIGDLRNAVQPPRRDIQY